MTIFVKDYASNLIILLLLGAFFGCTIPKPPKDPRIIDILIFKNSTGKYIQQVSISKDFSSPGAKVGSVSPLPINAQQIFERPAKAKGLPNVLQVHWIDRNNRLYKKEISIESILLSAAANQDKTIVIEFGASNMVKVYTLK